MARSSQGTAGRSRLEYRQHRLLSITFGQLPEFLFNWPGVGGDAVLIKEAKGLSGILVAAWNTAPGSGSHHTPTGTHHGHVLALTQKFKSANKRKGGRLQGHRDFREIGCFEKPLSYSCIQGMGPGLLG